MKAPLLLEYPALYSTLKRYRLKRDAKDVHGTLVALSFGLWGVWYVEKGFSGLVCNDGSQLPVHTAHLHTGTVIGRRDFEAAKGKPYAEAWRESLRDAINGRMGISS